MLCFFCFKQQKFEFLYQLVERKRLLSTVVGVATFSSDKHLDFHDTTFSVLSSLFKV